MEDEASAEFRIDTERKIIIITALGLVRPVHFAAMQKRARYDKNFDAGLGVLLDLREADLAMLAAEDIRQLATSSPAAPAARRAILVRYEVQATLARLFATFLEMDKRGARASYGRKRKPWLGLMDRLEVKKRFRRLDLKADCMTAAPSTINLLPRDAEWLCQLYCW